MRYSGLQIRGEVIYNGGPYSITERRVPELTPVLGSQPAGDVSHKNQAITFRQACSCPRLPKTVTRQRRGCDLNPGPSAPESSTLTTRLPSHLNSHTTFFY